VTLAEKDLAMARKLRADDGAHPRAKISRDSLKPEKATSRVFSEIAHITSREVGRPWVFALALGTIFVWAISGPLFQFSDTWQLVINTGTTIVTFLMVFLIQNSQNRDAAAIQVKLDELIRVSRAQNYFIGVEHLTDQELEDIRTRCESRAKAEATRRAGRIH
jgi:low affinity Fe/Cu permease